MREGNTFSPPLDVQPHGLVVVDQTGSVKVNRDKHNPIRGKDEGRMDRKNHVGDLQARQLRQSAKPL